ncbi:hypothetical protein [Domibacillus indicus]|uniref:hypothetical protein n=1 Tax=Domibacillus indicus TaxID=1437523 RepID=UPI000696E1C0|nr:hypothetical protein [Domibacillus indicus]
MFDAIRVNGLVIAADNSGSIGEKEHDAVQVPYETVGYFSARVALMECIAAGGNPFAAVLHNFSGDKAWRLLVKGIEKAAAEMDCELELTGSTESNFQLRESAAGLVVIGRHVRNMDQFEREQVKYAVIGKPLAGPEVITQPENVAPLSVFREMVRMEGVCAVLPVGSKGIAYELMQLAGKSGQCELDMEKSAGPSTCFIIAVKEEACKEIERAAGRVHWLEMIE